MKVDQFWDSVEAADNLEIASFVTHEVFKLDLRSNARNKIDGTWVRRWKTRNPPVIKSRCCGRGFLDVQRKDVNRHSSTASIISHRLAITYTAINHWTMEGFDVSTAFLRGLKFSEIHDRARALGHEDHENREVWLIPPANVWRHLRLLGFYTVEHCKRQIFCLALLKAMYGLVDGPRLFQLAFIHYFIHELDFRSSLHDENLLYLHVNRTLHEWPLGSGGDFRSSG